MLTEEQELKHSRIKIEGTFLLMEDLIIMIFGDMGLMLNVPLMILIYQDICLKELPIDSNQTFL